MNIIPRFVAQLEKRVALIPPLVKLYSRFYDEVVFNEIKLAGIDSSTRVLNIGCGGIPFTAIQIAKRTGARVWAVDRDRKAVEVATRCIASLNLEDQVTVLQLDGRDSIDFPFDVALVALQAEPKKEILANLARQGGQTARLIFRSPRRELSHQYDLLPSIPACTDRVSQNQVTFDYSVLYSELA